MNSHVFTPVRNPQHMRSEGLTVIVWAILLYVITGPRLTVTFITSHELRLTVHDYAERMYHTLALLVKIVIGQSVVILLLHVAGQLRSQRLVWGQELRSSFGFGPITSRRESTCAAIAF